ncbi:putative peptidoglycan glycosyltransferase FtsW [Falsirhodobacter algicola]|uniref:Probable peptidoglycan glycosyltransferase FtsW n=1 Tax=Falsirhodobacter algicola TaxID=2692330 RepID=A0A8J8MQT1_9RHOB|nr:putative peptidoglycan glycosyltransferase FtsW [Falsirhodobacter algicola]QUS35012.1 FtsW/RodA/SpoVE family cell cycle protein [Falsirhodobacter algicola]
MTEMVHGAIPARASEPVLPRWWRTIDKWSLTCIFILFGMGLLLALAASVPLATRNGLPQFYYVERQMFFGGMAMVAMVSISMMSPDMVRRLGVMGFLVAFLALILLPVAGTDFGKGAVRWYSLGFASFQPSEFLKPGFMIVTGWLMASSQEVNGPPGKRISFALLIVIAGFLSMQPDFGQTALILFGWSVIYFVGGAPMVLIATFIGAIVFAGTLFYESSEHFARRIDGFLNPELDPRTQLGYATNAIIEGGFFGVGVGEGQVKWSLPDAHTDFIIAVAAEEYGLILVLCIIALYATVVVRSLFRLMRERDPFIRLAGTGLACIFGVQAMINMGVAVRLLPAKGMTLPFVSYGGSSVIAAGITVGMLLALTRSRPQGEIGDILFNKRGR